MSGKRVIIDQSEWGIHDLDVDEVTTKVETAMLNGTAVKLPLLDKANRQVTVYLNGQAAGSVAVDLDLGPKPMEIGG